MGKQVSRGQALEVSARVATQVSWSDLDGDHLQEKVIDLSPEEFGRRLTAFFKNGCQFIFGDPKSVITKQFDPASFIGKGWATWKGLIDGDGLSGEEDIDQRSLAFTEIELAKFIFETCLKKGENSISGEEKICRLKKEKPEIVRFAGNVFLGLWLDYQANKKNSILEWFYRNFGITFMNFPGQVLRSPHGHRRILCLDRDDGGGWDWGYNWLDFQWDTDNPSVGCASQS